MPIIIFIFLIQWSAVCFAVTALDESTFVNEVPFLVIEPLSSREYGQYVIKRLQETLNLTCTVFDNSTNMEPRYNITWAIPTSSRNSKNHVEIQSSKNSVNLVVPSLEARDEGDYTCIAQPINRDLKSLSSVVTVNIKNRPKICGETKILCSRSQKQHCIAHRFRCDGVQDCEMGEDEDQDICGESPCFNKLQCKDHDTKIVRCIPKSWCCDIRFDANCTTIVPLSCCPPSFHKTYKDERSYYPSHQPHHTDIMFLQTTMYTVIGCAVVFMIVVTVLVIAVCRVHMKRTLVTQCPVNITQPPQNTALCDFDVYLNRGCTLDRGFLVTYNINNGVQIVGHAIDPPPYCEEISLPPREGPPPPYTSHEILDQPETEALLQQTTTMQNTRTDDNHLRRVVSEQYLLASAAAQQSPGVISSLNVLS